MLNPLALGPPILSAEYRDRGLPLHQSPDDRRHGRDYVLSKPIDVPRDGDRTVGFVAIFDVASESRVSDRGVRQLGHDPRCTATAKLP